ncbi:MAG: GNAT family N-acetyltransferase [Burkholderiales bacterium]
MARVQWRTAETQLASIRRTVFVDEQRVPEALEWDGLDADCVHALATVLNGTPVGAGRLLPDGHIGRMAVLKDWRGRGVGGALLAELVAAAREAGHAQARLNAQVHALDFYARFGFVASGPVFDDAGIPHRGMTLELK